MQIFHKYFFRIFRDSKCYSSWFDLLYLARDVLTNSEKKPVLCLYWKPLNNFSMKCCSFMVIFFYEVRQESEGINIDHSLSFWDIRYELVDSFMTIYEKPSSVICDNFFKTSCAFQMTFLQVLKLSLSILASKTHASDKHILIGINFSGSFHVKCVTLILHFFWQNRTVVLIQM